MKIDSLLNIVLCWCCCVFFFYDESFISNAIGCVIFFGHLVWRKGFFDAYVYERVVGKKWRVKKAIVFVSVPERRMDFFHSRQDMDKINVSCRVEGVYPKPMLFLYKDPDRVDKWVTRFSFINLFFFWKDFYARVFRFLMNADRCLKKKREVLVQNVLNEWRTY